VGLLLLVLIAGCSASSHVQHTPAQFTPIDTTRIADDRPEVVWTRLISRLPDAGFADLEIDDAAKAVRLSLSTDHPSDYVDCGRTLRTFEGIWGGVETFEYEPAGSSTYKLTNYEGDALEATREVALQATATVHVQPSANITEVSVDVTYDLRSQVRYNKDSVFAGDGGEPVIRTISFGTDRPGVGDGEAALCMSNGRFEAQILDLAA